MAHNPGMKSLGEVERVLVLDYLALPAAQQACIRAFPSFGNDRLVEYASVDFGPEPGETWAAGFISSAMQECLRAAQARGFDGGLMAYIAQHEPFLGWLMAQKADFNVTRILIRVVW